MFEHDGGLLTGAKVVLDGSGDRRFRKELVGYMRRELPKWAIKKFDFRDSRKDPHVQLADMCAAAIVRSYSDIRLDGAKWRNMLERSGCINDVWEIRYGCALLTYPCEPMERTPYGDSSVQQGDFTVFK